MTKSMTRERVVLLVSCLIACYSRDERLWSPYEGWMALCLRFRLFSRLGTLLRSLLTHLVVLRHSRSRCGSFRCRIFPSHSTNFPEPIVCFGLYANFEH